MDERPRLHTIILALVAQGCASRGGVLDSWAISAYEAALLELADAGYVELDSDAGRIMGRLTHAGETLLSHKSAAA